MILWNDNIGTIETKTFMRQILGNSNDEVNLIIFKKV